jgi:hypothetical protein
MFLTLIIFCQLRFIKNSKYSFVFFLIFYAYFHICMLHLRSLHNFVPHLGRVSSVQLWKPGNGYVWSEKCFENFRYVEELSLRNSHTSATESPSALLIYELDGSRTWLSIFNTLNAHTCLTIILRLFITLSDNQNMPLNINDSLFPRYYRKQ